MSPDKRHGDQRDEPLDFPTTREGPSVDEEKAGFQNIEGPGARRGEHVISSTEGSPEARALDAGNENPEDLDVGPGVDSATTGSPHAPTTGAGKQKNSRQ
ncbi:hypothetical protein [Azospirillum sp. sgz302134]